MFSGILFQKFTGLEFKNSILITNSFVYLKAIHSKTSKEFIRTPENVFLDFQKFLSQKLGKFKPRFGEFAGILLRICFVRNKSSPEFILHIALEN